MGLLLILVIGCKKEEETVFPDVTTKSVIVSKTDYADCGGIIGTNGTVEIISRGVIWGNDPNLIIGTHIGYTLDGEGPGEYNSIIKFLEFNIVYYVRAYAETSSKIIYGNILEFGLWRGPSVHTTGASLVKGKSAILNGYITPNNSATIVSIQVGTDTNYYQKIPFNEEPISGYGLYKLSYEIKDLEPNSVYHYRVIAENAISTAYGRDTLFKTKEVFEDFDHNSYPIVNIGTQAWMLENLKAVHYSNGDPIPNTPGSSAGLTAGNYWEYNNNSQFVLVYGRLYNYYAVVDGRNLCPTGWHMPTLAEVNALKSFLGEATGGNKLKESGAIHWDLPNTDATNESEFTALPGGYRNSEGIYASVKQKGYWLTSTESSSTNVNILSLSYSDPKITISSSNKTYGYSVRCIKGTVPIAITAGSDNITGISAVVNGIINPNYEPITVSFEYGLTQTYGTQINITDQEFIGNSPINVDVQITGLINGKTYHYRIKAESKYGVVYGNDATFLTNNIPSVTTYSSLFVSPGSVKLRGRVIANNSLTTVTFLLGETTDYGQILIPENNIINGIAPVFFEYELIDLPPDKTYHFAIKAINEIGETVGNDWEFTTELPRDFEGHQYGTVRLRSRYWMVQNLATTYFSNGDPIPEVQDLNTFINTTTPAYCNYNNSVELGGEYGRLYNAAVASDVRNVCPVGWTIPSEYLWDNLADYYNENELKETGTSHWSKTSTDVNNLAGFTAIPGGYRYTSDFKGLGIAGYWWCSSPTSPKVSTEYYIRLDITSGNQIILNDTKNHGYSIRCTKENMPIAKTGVATGITSTLATLKGSVNGNALSTTVSFGWGLYSYNENVSNATPDVISGSNVENVTLTLTNLNPGSTYYYRIRAVNSSGTVYGLGGTFTTLPAK